MRTRIEIKTRRQQRRKKGLRKRIGGGPDRPRLTVFRSLRHIYAQVIDDLSGRTLASASTRDTEGAGAPGGNCAAATVVGTRLAERAKNAGISQVVFDRSGRKYHGRVKALAEAAREAGLKF
jgi:large subunit ribosomal protein L18